MIVFFQEMESYFKSIDGLYINMNDNYDYLVVNVPINKDKYHRFYISIRLEYGRLFLKVDYFSDVTDSNKTIVEDLEIYNIIDLKTVLKCVYQLKHCTQLYKSLSDDTK